MVGLPSVGRRWAGPVVGVALAAAPLFPAPAHPVPPGQQASPPRATAAAPELFADPGERALLALGAVMLLLLAGVSGAAALRARRRSSPWSPAEGDAGGDRTPGELRADHERLQMILGQIPAVLWTTDDQLRFLSSGGMGLGELGLEHDQVVGRTLYEYFGTDNPELLPIRAHRRALEGASVSFEDEWGGRLFQSHVKPFRTTGGRIVGVIGVAIDVTESRETRRELETQRAYLKSLFEESPEAIVVVDEEDRVLTVNPEYTRIFGYTQEEAVGRKNADLIVPEHLREEADGLSRRVAGGDRVNVEAVRRRKDGSLLHVSVMGAPIHLDEGTLVSALYRDITERKELEAQFLHSQKMEAVGHLAGGIAHDFHNLLTVMLGHAELARAGAESDDMKRDLDAIQEAVERASALTGRLLTFSRKEVIRPEVLDLNRVLEGMKLLVRQAVPEDVEVVWDLEPSLPRLEMDQAQFGQIVMNLVVNARDAMSSLGGTLTLRTWSTTADQVAHGENHGDPEGGLVVLTVSDTGQGMTEEERSRMFEPFFTTKGPDRGTGLGLSTVYGIVEQAGGFLSVESERNRGTSISVYLPVEGAEVAARMEPAEAVEGPAQSAETLLVVEDDLPVRRLARRALCEQGYGVLEAVDAEEALEILQGARVDLLVTDVALPGMSGYELALELSRRRPGIPVLFMSGYGDVEGVRKEAQSHEPPVLTKPFHPGTLTRRVRELLGQARAARAGD